ncbi:MAG: hypothetical protein P0Y64_18340 [Candidatus Sphingomonas colombiensis]|nr:hypothetical protein [Sphingomonas sp.]WEK43249.1 MAG: hypothetical protein P0Y64_18340 [Sphingomonas sp.]
MTRQIAFLVLLVVSTLYAVLRGGRPEQIGAATLFAGAWISTLVVHPLGLRFFHIESGVLVTDVAILGVFLWLSVRCTRFWPIWIAAMLTAEVIVHIGLVIAPSVPWKAYMDATALWGWIAQLMLIVATWRTKRRQMDLGADAPWKP